MNNRSELLKAVQEVQEVYTRRYGDKAYPEAHILAKGVRVLISELDQANAALDEANARCLSYGNEVLALREQLKAQD